MDYCYCTCSYKYACDDNDKHSEKDDFNSDI